MQIMIKLMGRKKNRVQTNQIAKYLERTFQVFSVLIIKATIKSSWVNFFIIKKPRKNLKDCLLVKERNYSLSALSKITSGFGYKSSINMLSLKWFCNLVV